MMAPAQRSGRGMVAVAVALLSAQLAMADATTSGHRAGTTTSPTTPTSAAEGSPTTSSRTAGILYEVWHSAAATAMREVASQGHPQLTTELVIQSDGNRTLNDVYAKYGINADIYNVQPQLGFYCLYRHRAGDTHPPVPDCPNITGTLEAHASMLTAAGFDYVAVDVTNWPVWDAATDLAVGRPTEVLFDEWLALRQRGVKTPAIALWPCSPGAGGANATWRRQFDRLYNNATLADLVYRDESTGKKVVFIPDNPSCYNASEAAAMAANGGRNDVVTRRMWALFGHSSYNAGSWGFFSPCQTPTGAYTTSMVGANAGFEAPCDQPSTVNPATKDVVEVTASGAYMLSQSALPFANPGHMRGLTAQRLFTAVLNRSAPHLFMSSWNEFIGGRQAAAYHSNVAYNMGLPNDPQKGSVWVDTYASEYSRDIEPSVEGGGRVYEVVASCVGLYKAGETCASPGRGGEACCTTADKEIFGNVFSLARRDGGDRLLTVDANEVRVLTGNGGAYVEVCHSIGGPSAWCVDGGIKDGRDGPFMLYSQSPSDVPTQPLFRCYNASAGLHFVSVDSGCEGATTESTMGHIATRRGRETLRALLRCRDAAGVYSHSLDLPCDSPDGGVLGFVR